MANLIVGILIGIIIGILVCLVAMYSVARCEARNKKEETITDHVLRRLEGKK